MIRDHTKTFAEILGRGPIHPFPARMAPGIALEALGDNRQSLRVLDPMAGSGTVLAVARSQRHHAIGFDLDPLAVLLARVWTRTIDQQEFLDKAAEVLCRARHKFRSLKPRECYPFECDEATRAFIRFWFDDYARRQLFALSISIRRVHSDSIREALWCAFSRLIITKSSGASLAMDLSHSRPHKAFNRAPAKPFNRFMSAVNTVGANCPTRSRGPVGPLAAVMQGDARNLQVQAESIDLVLTSPPYLNAIDYMRCSKFSLVWMGYNIDQLRYIRGESVGAESSSEQATESPWVSAIIKDLGLMKRLCSRDRGLLGRYVFDMGNALAETARVLRPGGRAVYVVGDSTVRGVFVRNSEIVREVAVNNGLSLQERRSRTLPANRRYLPPPKRGAASTTIQGRMRREVVLSFEKPRYR